jgi:hypothetical protein
MSKALKFTLLGVLALLGIFANVADGIWAIIRLINGELDATFWVIFLRIVKFMFLGAITGILTFVFFLKAGKAKAKQLLEN